MDSKTGALYRDLADMDPEERERLTGRLVPLSEEQYETAKPMTRADRKGYMRNQQCPCGSGKKFKKCHWNDPEVLFDE